jgi:hypothetical protein
MFKAQFEADTTVVCSIINVVYCISVRQILLGYLITSNETSSTRNTSGNMTNEYKIVFGNV